MFDPAQLAALASVHRRGSFDLAAAELNVTPSAISQRLKALEETVGTLLIRRGTPAQATEVGLRMIRHFDEIALLDRALAVEIQGSQPRQTTLRIAVNADSLATWIIPALAEVPGFLYDLIVDDQDFSQEWLKRGEVSAAITSHPGPLQGCETLALGRFRYRATASPDYLARWMPNGPTAKALARAPALTFSDKDNLQDRWVRHYCPGARRRPAFPSHRMASTHAFVDACRHGLGWGLNPETLVAGLIAAGTLVELRPDSPFDIDLYLQYARLTAPAMASVTAALKRQAALFLLPPTVAG